MHHSCVFNIFFNTDLYKSVFPIYSFKKLVFRLSVFCTFCPFSFLFPHYKNYFQKQKYRFRKNILPEIFHASFDFVKTISFTKKKKGSNKNLK